MANYVTYYNGQRVEVTQETFNNWIAGNPGDEGRFGAAFANDDANLALHQAAPNYATQMVSSSPQDYATPTPTSSPVGQITTGSPGDGTILGTGPIGSLHIPSGPFVPDEYRQVPAPMAAGVVGLPSLPAWAFALAALLVFLYLERRA
jgi:hypothetical protein